MKRIQKWGPTGQVAASHAEILTVIVYDLLTARKTAGRAEILIVMVYDLHTA